MLVLFLGLCSFLLHCSLAASADDGAAAVVVGARDGPSGSRDTGVDWLPSTDAAEDGAPRRNPSSSAADAREDVPDDSLGCNGSAVQRQPSSPPPGCTSRSTGPPVPEEELAPEEEEMEDEDVEESGTACRYPVTVLDFLHDWSNSSQLEAEWPCEVRVYWTERLHPLVTLVRSLLSYCAPVIVVLGLIMNTMAFAVLSTKAFSSSSLSVYLRALAVTDNCALIFNVSVSVLRSHVQFLANLFLTHEWLCALNKVLLGMSFYYSTWLVVSLTWERLATITYPLTLGVWCSKKVAIMVVCTLGVLSSMVGVVRVKYSGFEQDSVFEFEPCAVHALPLHRSSTMYVYLVLSLWLPLVLIVVGNMCLVATLRRSARTRSALTVKKDRDTLRRTRMLLIVSMAYVILLLPLGVVSTLDLFWNLASKHDPFQKDSTHCSHWLERKLLLKWMRGLFYFVYLFNFSINFFLYCMSGKKFQRAAAQHFRRRLSQPLSRLYRSSPSSSVQGDSPRKPSNPAPACVNDAFVDDEATQPATGRGTPVTSDRVDGQPRVKTAAGRRAGADRAHIEQLMV